MSDEIIVVNDENKSVVSIHEQYGYYTRKSRACPICNRTDHNEINLLRARDHKSLKEIATERGVTVKDLTRHFEYHFVVSESNMEIIRTFENTDSERKEIITRAFEGNLDIIVGASAVLKNQAFRLNDINARIKVLSEEYERDLLEDEEKSEYVELHKLANQIEKEMMKNYERIDKKLFPPTKEELFDVVLSYKLDVVSKMLDHVWLELANFSNRGSEYKKFVDELKEALAIRFNMMEDEILKSGGVLRPESNYFE